MWPHSPPALTYWTSLFLCAVLTGPDVERVPPTTLPTAAGTQGSFLQRGTALSVCEVSGKGLLLSKQFKILPQTYSPFSGQVFFTSPSPTPLPPDHPQVLQSVLITRAVHLSLNQFPPSGSGPSLHIFCTEVNIKGGLGRAANAEIKAFILMGTTCPQKYFFNLSASCTACTDTHRTYMV